MDSAEPSAVGTAVAAAVAVFAALISLVIGLRTLKLQKQIAEEQAERHYAFEGAMAAITWRAEVFALHDRGLSPSQIRRIMLLEDGGEGYERRSNGRIDEILRDAPRREHSTPSA